MITFDSNPVWFVALIVLIPIWAGLYFYAHHRVLHMGFMYRHVHAWHHRNINTGPWSGLAMHPVESFYFNDGYVDLASGPRASHPCYFPVVPPRDRRANVPRRI